MNTSEQGPPVTPVTLLTQATLKRAKWAKLCIETTRYLGLVNDAMNDSKQRFSITSTRTDLIKWRNCVHVTFQDLDRPNTKTNDEYLVLIRAMADTDHQLAMVAIHKQSRQLEHVINQATRHLQMSSLVPYDDPHHYQTECTHIQNLTTLHVGIVKMMQIDMTGPPSDLTYRVLGLLDDSNELWCTFASRLSHHIPVLSEWIPLREQLPHLFQNHPEVADALVNPLETYAEQQCQCIPLDICHHGFGVDWGHYFMEHELVHGGTNHTNAVDSDEVRPVFTPCDIE
jgi:hypothetical protein